MDFDFVNSQIRNYHVRNISLNVIVFLIMFYYFENKSIYILIGNLVIYLISTFYSPKCFLVDFKIDNEKIILKTINTNFSKSEESFLISNFKSYRFERSGFISEEINLKLYYDMTTDSLIIPNDVLAFKIERLFATHGIKEKKKFFNII